MVQTLPQNVLTFWRWWKTPVATERNQAFQEQALRILIMVLWCSTIVTGVIAYFVSFELLIIIVSGIIPTSIASYTISKGNTIVTEAMITLTFTTSIVIEVSTRTVYSRYVTLALVIFTIIGLLLFSRIAFTVYLMYIGLFISIIVSGITETTTETETVNAMTDLISYGIVSILPLSAFRNESQKRLDEMTRLAQESEEARHDAEESRQEAEEARHEAEEANQLKSQFLATVSHELRTPLNAILNFSKFVSSGRMGEVNERQVNALNNVVGSGDHLLALINDILDISKIESGSLKLYIEPEIDLQKMIRLVVATGESLLHEKPVKIIANVDENMPSIACDRQRIHQILLNLVSNACKFTESGQITIAAKPSDNNMVMVSVKDTGSGIPAEDHEKIFDVFTQAERGIAQGEGTGLGLAISKRLAEAHHGSLSVESKEGQGSTFFLRLPISNLEVVDAK